MKAAVLLNPGKFSIQEIPDQTPGPDEILVRMKVCGICTSELDMWLGNNSSLQFPLYLGHEGAGEVVETGSNVDNFSVGDHVAMWSDGRAFAEYIVIHTQYVYKLDKKTRFDLALGEPIACSVNGVRKLDPQFNDTVCIVGCGFMGLILLQLLHLRGTGMVVAVDTRDDILQIAGSLGADHIFNPLRDDVTKKIRDLTGGKGVDIGIEAAGIQQTIDMVTQVTKMEGKIEIFGYHQGSHRIIDWGYWNWMAFQIVNGHTRNPDIYVEGMNIGLELLESGKLNMDKLVTHTFPFESINEGFQKAADKDPGFVKGVITF